MPRLHWVSFERNIIFHLDAIRSHCHRGGAVRSARISVLATLAVLSCQPDQSRSSVPEAQLRNGTGAQIIENARPPEGSRLGWRVAPEPTVSIGALDGEDPYLFTSAPDATRLSDGRIVVVEPGSAELRVFDGTSGTHLATWGGRGEGPGEFSELSRVHPLPGDSIMAWSYLPIVTVLDSDGNYVRSFRPAPPEDGSLGPRFLTPVAALDDGSILASVYIESADTTVVEVWDAAGKLLGALGAHAAHAPRVTNEFLHFETFGWNLKLATWGELAIVTPSDRYEIRAFEPDGTLARIVRMEHVRRSRRRGGHVEAYIEGMVAKGQREPSPAGPPSSPRRAGRGVLPGFLVRPGRSPRSPLGRGIRGARRG